MPVDTKNNEGFKENIYADTRKHPTVGTGYNLDDPVTRSMVPADVVSGKRSISPEEDADTYKKRFGLAKQDASDFFGEDTMAGLDKDRRDVIHDMSYQMGKPVLSEFKKFKAAVVKKDYDKAADEIENSKYYKDKDTHNRAKENTRIMRKGTPQQKLGEAVLEQLR